MHRERMDRVRAVMREQGLDALVLLGNTNVVYATGAIWPLADSGRANFEQPVAVVLVDDEWPHLFSPMREDDGFVTELPSDHLHGPVYLDFDEGVQLFASQLAGLVPDNAVIAMDEWTNALRREQSILFAPDAPVDGGRVISEAKATKTPDELSCMREGLRITERAIADVQARVAPGVRQTDLTATFLRTIFEAGADANILDPIWQVMPVPDGRRAMDHDRRPRLPAPLDRTRARRRRRPVGRHRHQLRRLPLRLRTDLDRRTRAGRPAAGAVRTVAGDQGRRPRRHPGRSDGGGSDGCRHRRRRWREAVDAALLPRSRPRHRQRRDALRRERHRRGVRRHARPRRGDGPGDRADRLGGRCRRLPLRGGAAHHARTDGSP